MTSSAVCAELSVVDVVACVAIAASAAQSCLDIKGLPVTGIAANGAMGAVESECRLCVVVESPLRPVNR
jgi:hypothetical protein